MLPIWLITTLPLWLVIFIILCAIATLYVAVRYREVRKFLAGAFFVSSGVLSYLWQTGTSIPIVLPYAGTISIETPDISGQRAVVHFICSYCACISAFSAKRMRLQTKIVTGFSDVRFGSKADIHRCKIHVGFRPEPDSRSGCDAIFVSFCASPLRTRAV